jgi:hypothetical protein
MQYKTIILELLQQRPQMHERLRKERMLLPTMERYARELRTRHLEWKELLLERQPDSEPGQIASEALEIALKELEDRLPPDSPESDGPNLDEAMASVRRHTPRG